MDDIGALVSDLAKTGPFGAAIAGLVIALALAIIIFARVKDLWSDDKGRSQSIEVADLTLKLIDTLMASERALRERIDEISRERDHDRDEIDALRADLALVRGQRRRLIELLRARRSDHSVADPRAEAGAR